MEYDEEVDVEAKRIIGDVIFKHDSTYLYCDSAYLYESSNTLKAYGNVHIAVSDTLNIFGDSLEYSGNTKFAEMHDNVVMKDKQITLTTDHLNYNIEENIANYYDGGRIVGRQNDLTSVTGYYYSDFKEFSFKDSVILVNPKYTMNSDTLKYNTATEIAFFFGPTDIVSKENTIYCENGWYDTKNDVSQFNKNAYLNNKEQTIKGDSLFYDRVTGFGRAFENVILTDTVQNIILMGHYGELNETERISLLTDSTVAKIIGKKDTMFMHSDSLIFVYDSTKVGKTLYSFRKVKYYSMDIQGMCDSLVYDFKDSVIIMSNNPVIWSGENQLYADSIEIYLKNENLDKMYLHNTGFMISKEDTAYYNQVKGKELAGFFKDNKISKITVKGNSETIYFGRDNGYLTGVNKAVSDDLLIFLKQNEINTITFISNADATLYPVEELSPAELKLKDFKWFESKRPKDKHDIFNW